MIDIFSEMLSWDEKVAAVWQYQYENNAIVRDFCTLLKKESPTFLPIEFFKRFPLQTGEWEATAIFESSKTTGQIPSRHFVKDLERYRRLSVEGFFHFFPKKKYKILALLPSYLERGNSSLVQMVKFWIEDFGEEGSGFYLNNFEALERELSFAAATETPTIFIGVAFALLDFAENFKGKLPKDSIIIETGGMKGRKTEITRKEMHEILQKGLGATTIHSEYGMTELMSQAYSLENGKFYPAPTLKVFISDIHLPDVPQKIGVTGRINLIDLGNIDSCAFISTDDAGRMYQDGSFEVLGRIDNAELRGCNLMYL